MFENKNDVIALLQHPMTAAAAALDEISDRLGGTRVVADVNSPFCHLLEFSSSITAAAVQAMEDRLATVYPARATAVEELLPHMSDFDYLEMYALPSSVLFRMSLPKPYLIANAIPVNENYKQITIPKDMMIAFEGHVFGIYYPINIVISNYTNTIDVRYDTTTTNPLHAITSNVVDTSDTSSQGLDMLLITFPIYQFSKSVKKYTLVGETGFAEKIFYTNKFYAIRIFSYSKVDGQEVYTELHQSQSELNYNSTVPTALVNVLLDENTVHIVIPQIYFSQNLLGSQLYVELYTTEGELTLATSNITSDKITVNYGMNSKDTTKYSSIFSKLPFSQLFQLASNVMGGRNPISASELRNKVINNTMYRAVPITEQDLENYLNDRGFSVRKSLDNVTDRIYYAYRVLTDDKGAIVPSVYMQMKIFESYVDTHSSFVKQSDGSITILPTTMYLYDTATDSVAPIDDAEMTKLSEMDKAELVNALNNTSYFRSPYHICISLADLYPQAVSFDLMTPEVVSLLADTENFNITSRMTAYDATISHLDSGVGGYRVDMTVSKTADLAEVPEEDIKVIIAVQTSDGYWIHTEATKYMDLATRYAYTFNIKTNYHLTLNNEIYVTNMVNDAVALSEYAVPLTSDFYIIFLASRTALVGNVSEASTELTMGVPSEILADYIGLSRQHIRVVLGSSLNDVIRHNIEVSATALLYATWDHDVPDLYDEDVYAKDRDGKLIYDIGEDGQVELQLLHAMGTQKVNAQGELMWKHRVGDVRYDSAGQPIPVADRDKVYYMDLILIDAKVFASERSAEMNFVASMYANMSTYFDKLRELQQHMLERTFIYFRCVRSCGMANFNYGDGLIMKDNIEMSFRIMCYVPSYVKKDEVIQQKITDLICTTIEDAIQTKTISMMDIFQEVQTKLSDYVDHFTLLGVNDNIEHQTFIIVDDDAQASIARKLVLSDDNIISLSKQIDVKFVALVSNNETVSVSV